MKDLDERDLALLHGLQIAPRASWAEAARILDSTPATLAGRWARLHTEGLAWVTAHPGGDYQRIVLALVEVDCLPGARADAVRAVCADPRAVTVEESTRGRDLLLTVITRDLAELTRFVLDDLPRLPGVERQRTHVVSATHRDGSSWRLDALSPQQQRAFEAAARTLRPVPGVSAQANARALIGALAYDGRQAAADLARRTGRNPATVRRQLGRLLSSGLLSFRCEVAQSVSNWPISSTWMGSVAPADHQRTVQALATFPELRLCASTTGDSNIVFTFWTRSLPDLLRLEGLIGERIPWLRVKDNGVNLRTPKRMGWMLHPDGRATGEVIPPAAL
ncbi:Lrp/AsnC ligand binding domain-containing protein [Saccharopolyspora phatthalungensis]|uniref:DNA-binding Lrp family transcriptional regulator n=1 Tax=Saccharopolyspora phatthalungensis TaxID=664693 RepID=A0A840Q491_9PSEU|nr:Lrp/AsnC ligand binding domain-containing protein [Saccharopolyspora phatthalungensis]MBB5153519.1 DNA-binding Lrp family transcriptional regulator [Saccharopolyspora phatthalungensis]